MIYTNNCSHIFFSILLMLTTFDFPIWMRLSCINLNKLLYHSFWEIYFM